MVNNTELVSSIFNAPAAQMLGIQRHLSCLLRRQLNKNEFWNSANIFVFWASKQGWKNPRKWFSLFSQHKRRLVQALPQLKSPLIRIKGNDPHYGIFRVIGFSELSDLWNNLCVRLPIVAVTWKPACRKLGPLERRDDRDRKHFWCEINDIWKHLLRTVWGLEPFTRDHSFRK